jgi:hypothetical protein
MFGNAAPDDETTRPALDPNEGSETAALLPPLSHVATSTDRRWINYVYDYDPRRPFFAATTEANTIAATGTSTIAYITLADGAQGDSQVPWHSFGNGTLNAETLERWTVGTLEPRPRVAGSNFRPPVEEDDTYRSPGAMFGVIASPPEPFLVASPATLSTEPPAVPTRVTASISATAVPRAFGTSPNSEFATEGQPLSGQQQQLQWHYNDNDRSSFGMHRVRPSQDINSGDFIFEEDSPTAASSSERGNDGPQNGYQALDSFVPSIPS